MFFLFFSILPFVFSSTSNKDQKIHTEWYAETRDRHIYVGTSNGVIYFINIFTGNIDFSVDTGGDLYNSSTLDHFTFLPSIDGFLLAYNEAKINRFPEPIKNFEPKSSRDGITISSTNTTVSYLINERNGKVQQILKNKTSTKTNGGLRNSDNNAILPAGFSQVVRTDYSLIINNSKDEAATIRYSDFNIKTSKIKIFNVQEVKVFTTFQGEVVLTVNDSIISRQKIDNVPIIVFGTQGLFNFTSHAYMTVSHEQQVFFVQNSFAVPTSPFEKNSNLPQRKSLSVQKSNLNGNNFFRASGNFEFSKMEINYKEMNVMISANSNNNHKNNKNNIYLNEKLKEGVIPFGLICTFLVILVSMQVRIVREQKKRIQSSTFAISNVDLVKGVANVGSAKCRIVPVRDINEIGQIYARIGELGIPSSLILTPKITEKLDDKLTLAAFNFYEHYDFGTNNESDSRFDPVVFLKISLSTLDVLHRNNITHNTICEECFFRSNDSDNNAPIFGGFEKETNLNTSQNDTKRFSNDINCLKNIVRAHISLAPSKSLSPYSSMYLNLSMKNGKNNHYNYSGGNNTCRIGNISIDTNSVNYCGTNGDIKVSNDPILNDFLDNTSTASFESESYQTAAELLKHPLFMSAADKIRVYEKAYDALFSQEQSKETLKRFEQGKADIFYKKWTSKIPKLLLREGKCWYNTSELKDLVKFIRNKWQHKNNRQNAYPAVYGDGSHAAYFRFFHREFPNLFMYVFHFLENYSK